jgi:hypothetical protein
VHQSVEQLLGHREPVDVGDAGGIEPLRLVADGPSIGSTLGLSEDGSGAGQEQDTGGGDADRGAGAPLSSVRAMLSPRGRVV